MAARDVLTRPTRICGTALIVITPLIAAAWLPVGFPYLLRQVLLLVWGVGAILVAERRLFAHALTKALRAVGFAPVRTLVLALALVASVPMWMFLPSVVDERSAPSLRPDWVPLLIGVVLVNGITEEVIHRGFVFAQLRRERPFAVAATLSAAVFAAQHLYIIVTSEWIIGLASVLLAALLSYPMALAFERGGNSIVGPAILHTSSNAPVMILAMPEDLVASVLLPHMGVILVSLWSMFLPARPRRLERRTGSSKSP